MGDNTNKVTGPKGKISLFTPYEESLSEKPIEYFDNIDNAVFSITINPNDKDEIKFFENQILTFTARVSINRAALWEFSFNPSTMEEEDVPDIGHRIIFRTTQQGSTGSIVERYDAMFEDKATTR